VGADGVLSVVLIERDALCRTTVKSQISQLGMKVVGEAENLVTGLSLIKGLHPDLVILELPSHPEQTLQAVRALKHEHPNAGIIITANDASPQIILRCMRAGAQEFLTRPLDPRELVEAVQRMSGMVKRGSEGRKKTGKIITVFSGKGGVGVTSIATNLAVSLVRNQNRPTVMVDLNLQMGDVGLLLDLRPEYTLSNALGTDTIDESRLKGLLAEHDSGLYLLAAPDDPVEAEMISPGLLLEVFSILKGMFDFIVVDAGHAFDSRILEVLNLADTILLLAHLDVPTVRNTRRCMELFGQLGYSTEKVRLVANRYHKKGKVRVEDLEETVETSVFWQIPNDYQTLIAGIDAGVPAILQSPRAKITKNLAELADQLCQIHDRVAEHGTARPDVVSGEPPQRKVAGK
jgi:pilus assembly protein CpaE